MPDTTVHRIRHWSGQPGDESPICGASASWEITSDRTTYPHYVTCPKCRACQNDLIPIVAYTERPSTDPQTGKEGITRTEWRVVPGDFYRDRDPYRKRRFRLSDIYHQAYTMYRLERRTIRRGIDLGWEPIEVCDNRIEAMMMVDNITSASLVVLDSDLIGIQEVCRQLRAESKDEQERREAKEREEIERGRLRAESEDAFRRLHQSVGKVWADRWNAITSGASAEIVAKLRADRHAVELHDAVIAAVTVPAKRKAIRMALAYYAGVLGKSSTEELVGRKGSE